MFVDASAICSALLHEADGDDFYRSIVTADEALTSSMAIWESSVAVARVEGVPPLEALHSVKRFLEAANVRLVAVPPEAAAIAVEAFERFGKGRHPAALNFGDCFAYACARHFKVPLLFKGDDFRRTDIETAAIGD